MKWAELSDSAGLVLEQCWSLRTDNPRTVTVRIGDMLHGGNVFTEEVYQEILKYKVEQEVEGTWDADFLVSRDGDTVRVEGLPWKEVIQ